MKTRIAYCGHDYAVPDEFWAGRRRNRCDECVRSDRTLSEAKRNHLIGTRARVAATARWGRGTLLAPRKARCGHEVPYHPGLARKACDACTPIRKPRLPPQEKTCERCGGVFTASRQAARFCSRSCSSTKYAPRCTAPGCSRPHQAKGLCGTHYNDARYTSERRHAYATPRPCEHCGKDFHARRKGQRFCSLLCRSGGEIQEWTDAQRRAFREARRKRRALMRQAEHEDFGELEIYERDRWRCGICRKRVSQKLNWPHPMSSTLDHIVPVTEHGGHTRANVRLAHLVCNTRRGNRGGGEQLALIG